MPHVLLLALPLLISFLITLGLMPWLLRLCQRKGLFDLPGERKVHTARIPRLGGLLFAPAMIGAMGIGALALRFAAPDDTTLSIRLSTLIILAGLLINYFVGVLDDLFGLRAGIKFAVQFVASLLFPLCGLYINNLYGLFGIEILPLWVGYPLTVLACLLIVNAYNLIDGIDGLSSSLALLALALFAHLFWQLEVGSYTYLCLALIGSIVAFLRFNLWGKVERGTKIFMGDTGSLVLGYTLAYLAFKYTMHNPSVLPYRPSAFLIALTLLAIPIFDLIRVAVGRLLRGIAIFHPDRSHIHHLCMDAGFSMRQSLLLILGLQLSLILMAYTSLHYFQLSPTIVLALEVLLFSLFVFALRFRKNKLPQPQ